MNSMTKDLTVPGLIHDLNNVFQTLVAAADRLSQDAEWSPLSQAILRSVERGMRISLSLQSVKNPGAPFASILADAISFVEDARLVMPGPPIRFQRNVSSKIVLRRNWAWERVLINLFLNSARAMPDGGTIAVEARRSGSDFLMVVRDTGTGIAPQILEQLFKPHVSTKPPVSNKPRISTKQQGGLGLHVVETIVHEDGGTVRARNRSDGPGAEFIITVPLSIAAMPSSKAARASG
jgi:signal transduction histidine kinase